MLQTSGFHTAVVSQTMELRIRAALLSLYPQCPEWAAPLIEVLSPNWKAPGSEYPYLSYVLQALDNAYLHLLVARISI